MGTESIACPPGYTMVIRDIQVYASATPGSQFGFFFKDHGTGGALVPVFVDVVPTSGHIIFQWQGRIVIGTGGALDFNPSIPTDICVSGYLLSGVAPVQIVGAPLP